MTPKSPKVFRMYILAAVIGIAIFLIAVTAVVDLATSIRSLLKNNGHLN